VKEIFTVNGDPLSAISLRRSWGSDFFFTGGGLLWRRGGLRLMTDGGITFSAEYRLMSSQPLCAGSAGGEMGEIVSWACFRDGAMYVVED
tara:strand:+ start:9082 stop:9351 length:270 start_codon:yes stop_codon:yes gene_type:complete